MNTRTMSQWCGGIVLAFAVLVAFVLPQTAAADDVSDESRTPAYYMKKLYEIGKRFGNPETLQALMMHESKGIPTAVGNPRGALRERSYGLMQIQIVAARSILQRNRYLVEEYFPDRAYKSISDQDIATLLVENPEANMTIGALHFNLYLKLSKGNWPRAVAANNVGIGAVTRIENPAEFSYVKAIQQKLEKIVKPFNRKNGLSLTLES